MGANLRAADLSGAALAQTDLSGAIFEATVLGDLDLATVNGLETIHHSGPSHMGSIRFTAPPAKFPKFSYAVSAFPKSSSRT
jgi:uncharacterized protein YjbI with pentapeptide repeats